MTDQVPVVDFDSTDQGLLFGDLELFEQVRSAGGIAWSERNGGLWVVASHELCRTVASDHERFRSGDGIRFPRAGNPMIFALEYDRPRHTDHRRILTDLAGPRATTAIEPTVRAHAKRLIGQSVADGRIDLGAAYAYPLALDVIFSLIGAPEDIKGEMEQLAESLFLYRRPMPDGGDPAQRLRTILERLVAERTAEPMTRGSRRSSPARVHPTA